MKKTNRILMFIVALATLVCLSCTVAFAVDVPKRPDKVTAQVNTSTVILSWDKCEGATGYRVFQAIGGKWVSLKTTGALSHAVTGLKAGTSYRFAVRPYVKVDGVAYWATSYTTVTVKTEAKNTVKANAIAYSDSVTITWNESAGATGYRVFRKVNGKWAALKTTGNLFYTVSGLTASTNYEFCVRSYIKHNGTVYWNGYYSTVKAKTDVLTDITLSGDADYNTVNLTWKKSAGASGYRVFKRENNKWVKVIDLSKDKTSYSIGSLKENTSYTFVVRAYAKTDAGVVWGKLPESVLIRTESLSKVKITEIAPSTDSVTLTWNAVPGATGYGVFSYEKGKYTAVKAVTSTSYTWTGLKSDTMYQVVVRAYNNESGKVNWLVMGDIESFATEPTEADLDNSIENSRYVGRYYYALDGDCHIIFNAKLYEDGALVYELPGEVAVSGEYSYVNVTTQEEQCRIISYDLCQNYYFVYDEKKSFVYMTQSQAGGIYPAMVIKELGFFEEWPDFTVTIEEYDGKKVVCEAYTTYDEDYSDKPITVKAYFSGKELIGTVVNYGNGYEEHFDITYITTSIKGNNIPSSLFKIPSDYKGYIIQE